MQNMQLIRLPALNGTYTMDVKHRSTITFIELIREFEFTASIEVSGTYSYNILENDYDLDLESEVTDALFADSQNGNIEITDQEVCNVSER